MAKNSSDSEVKYCDQLPVPASFKEEHIRAAIGYRARDGDVVLCGYPKTGNTWISYIIWMILNNEEKYPSFDEVTNVRIPFIDFTGTSPLEFLESPRFYKTHLPYNMINSNPRAKYVYTYRKPEDTVVSFYHFHKGFLKPGDAFPDMGTFFRKFMNGICPYGDYFDHLLRAYPHRHGNVLMVSYENLKRKTRDEILRITEFLGEEYYDNLKSNESFLDKIIHLTSFDHMKKTLFLKAPATHEDGEEKIVDFFRKGVIGDGKMSLNEDQLREMYMTALEKVGHTEIHNEWSK